MVTLITYDEAKDVIGTIPKLDPHPNADILQALSKYIEEKLETIPSHQSAEFGYMGMAMPVEQYALRTNTPWMDWNNPGPHLHPGAMTRCSRTTTRLSTTQTRLYGIHNRT
jgi:hypothetical protein